MRVELIAKSLLVGLATALFVLGCGTDPDKPVYDTSRNPDDFPAAACQLLDGIDDGRLATFEAVSNGMAQLYTDHPELLDNERWQGVIRQLGLKFRLWAERYAELGLEGFSRAAWYYMLASQADVDDSAAAAGAALYAPWFRVEREHPTLVDSASAPGAPLPVRLRLLREFVFADSVRQAFASEVLLAEFDQVAVLDSIEVRQLSLADQAFVAFLGLRDLERVPIMMRFEEPPIDMITMTTRAVDDDRCRSEFYFTARERMDQSYWLSMLVGLDENTVLPTDSVAQGALGFAPHVPTFRWVPGRIQAASILFDCEGPTDNLAVTLFAHGREGLLLARPEGVEGPYLRLTVGSDGR